VREDHDFCVFRSAASVGLCWQVPKRFGGLFLPFNAYCCHMDTAMKHPVPDRVISRHV